MKPVAYFLCALALILICISPWLIMSYYEKLPEEPYFQGILTLWHITGWRTGGSSGFAFLEKRIAQFESQNPHVFIDLKAMSADEAQKALENGETPDLVSYPYNYEPPLTLIKLERMNTIYPNISDTAYPYMSGGYCLLFNTDLLAQNGIDIKADDIIRPESVIEAAQYGTAFDAEPGFSGLPAMARHVFPPAERPSTSTWREPDPPDAILHMQGEWADGLNLFTQGKVAVLVASHRQLFEALDGMTQSAMPSFAVFAMGPYTDMVQLIGVTAQEDALRTQASESFARFLLSNGVQKKLEALGVFPVISGLDVYTEDSIRRAIYEQLCEGAVVPRAGMSDELESLSKEALSGDSRALERLRAMLGGF